MLEVARHQGERLVAPRLALPKSQNRSGIARIGHEMKAAQPLDGDDLTREQGTHGVR
jgi:hypothetical protein